MFKSNFNIIVGENNTWKTSFLHNFSYELKEKFNKRIIFISSIIDGDNKNSSFMNNRYYLHRSISYRFDYETPGITVLKTIEEICKREKIDFIFIDDIEFMNEKHLEILKRIPIIKIATSTKNFDFIDSTNYYIEKEYKNGKHSTMINNIDITSLIKSYIRDEKLKTII